MENSDDDTGDGGHVPKTFILNLDREDRELLDRMAAAEKLKRSDVVRRALRRYAKDLGLETKPAA